MAIVDSAQALQFPTAPILPRDPTLSGSFI